ncbi:3'(2'),5'-bisphosphate nucleotidase CysQ [Thalassovita sp.]|uniref:inositol monophosphatase family protein n=1 Tax=Thalassovita sp. TaxID=1979401 RepID=UPI002AB1AEC1|nr:3'(2'),5'-bisphosphate nucleotidase CysQ [Thalassovita sp.]
MPATDLDLLIHAARLAGETALKYSGPQAKSWDKPGDLGPVTEADLAVNDVLHRELLGARPDYGWLSEESQDGSTRLDQEKLFIVDPIDGTRSFIEGSNAWAHSIAVAQGGEITAAVVLLPAKDRLYAAAKGQGTTLNGTQVGVTAREGVSGCSVLSARPNYAPEHWIDGVVPDVKRVYRPSLAYRLSLVAQGRFDAMLTLRDSWEWDIAAGALILTEAGAKVTDMHGAPLRFNNAHPQVKGVVAAGPALHADLSKRLVSTQQTG